MLHPHLPGSYEDLYRQAMEAAQSGDVPGAIAILTRVVDKLARLSPSTFDYRPVLLTVQLQASLQLVEWLQSQGLYAEAIAVEERLLTSHPADATVWRRDIAILRLSKGEVDRGLADLQSLAEEQPDDARNWMLVGNEARIEGRFAESQTSLSRALELASAGQDAAMLAEIHYSLFRLHEAMGRMDEALVAWEESVKQEPRVVNTVREVCIMLTDAGRYLQAQEYVARDGNPLQAGLQRGLIAQLTGDAAEAAREWQTVAALDPTQFPYGQECWAEAALRVGDSQPVLERLPLLFRKHGSLRLLVLAGMAWAMQGDREKAQKTFDQCINLLRRGRPPKQKLDGADWRLLNSLVADEEIRTALKPNFAVVETLWG